MTHFDHIYLALTLICLGLLFKIIRDGIHELRQIQQEIARTQEAREQAIQKAETAQEQLVVLKKEAEQFAGEVRTLEEQDQSLVQEIEKLEGKIGGKSRVQRNITLAKLDNI